MVVALRKIAMKMHDGEIFWHIEVSAIPSYWMLERLIFAKTFDCVPDRRVFPLFLCTVEFDYLQCASTVGQLDLHDILMPAFSHS